MKTKEFINRMNELNYVVVQGTTETCVFDRPAHNTVALINEKSQNRANLGFASLSNVSFDVVISYAKTPISERRDVIRKRVKVVSTDESSYLHICYLSYKQEAYLGSLSDQDLTNVMADFSPEQIEQLKSRDDIAIDWCKVKLEDAD